MTPYHVVVQCLGCGDDPQIVSVSTLTEALYLVQFCNKHGLEAHWWAW
mgnify:FL=1